MGTKESSWLQATSLLIRGPEQQIKYATRSGHAHMFEGFFSDQQCFPISACERFLFSRLIYDYIVGRFSLFAFKFSLFAHIRCFFFLTIRQAKSNDSCIIGKPSF